MGKRPRPRARLRQGVSSSGRVWNRLLPSPAHTDRLGRAIGSVLAGGESLALSGTLGAGKTALVRGIAAGLGAPASAVSSPTFVLLHEYEGRLPLAHIDLYRLTSSKEVETIGLADYLSGQTVVAVEWADKAPGLLPDDRLEMELRHRTVQSRSITFKATGPLSAALLSRLKHHESHRKRRVDTPTPQQRAVKGKSSS